VYQQADELPAAFPYTDFSSLFHVRKRIQLNHGSTLQPIQSLFLHTFLSHEIDAYVLFPKTVHSACSLTHHLLPSAKV
jgi:hypothetical protein